MILTSSHTSITVKDLVFGTLLALCTVCGLGQMLIDSSSDNVLSTAYVMGSSSLVFGYLWRGNATTTHPLSSLSIIGLVNSTQFASLVAQTVELQSLTQLLRAPTFTFFMLSVVISMAVLTHYGYRHFTPLANVSAFIANRIYAPLRAFERPQPLVIWCLAALGMAAQVAGGGKMGDVGGKFLFGFSFLIWMPFLIPIYQSTSNGTYCNLKKQLPLVILHGLAIAADSLIKNGRGGLFAAPVQLVLLYLLFFMHTPHRVTARFLRGMAVLAVVAGVSVTVMSDLATAMVIARDKRDSVSTRELLETTYNAFMDKAAIAAYRERNLASSAWSMYDESYLQNPLLARFSETKFHDNMFFVVSELTEAERGEAAHESIFRIVLLLPQTVLDFFELKIQKDFYRYSMGDYFVNLHHGAGVGSYLTGSIWAEIYDVSGSWFPVTCALMLLPCFWLFDAMVKPGAGFVVAPPAMCTAWQIFHFGLGGESISAKASFLLRDTPQRVLLYALALASVTLVLRLFRLYPERRAVTQT